MWRNQSLVGVFAGGQTREEDEADHEALLALVGRGRTGEPRHGGGLHAVPDALEAVAAGAAIGKLVVAVDSG